MKKEGLIKRILLAGFALSGMTALVYEVVWARPLQLIFGSTIYAVSTMLTSFMFGFALGSYLFRNKVDKTDNPAMLFAKLEIGIGLYGFVILLLFKILPAIYLKLVEVPGFLYLQFILCFAVLLLPAILFGATWPAITKAYAKTEQVGKDVGVLYSWNSFGAVCGSIAAGFLLIPLLGITKTTYLAASVNILIGIVIFVVFKKEVKKKEIGKIGLLFIGGLLLSGVQAVDVAARECADLQNDILWSSGYSNTKESAKYYVWKYDNCPGTDCSVEKMSVYTRNLYTGTSAENAFGDGYVLIADAEESNCVYPSLATYTKYVAYQTATRTDDMVFVWDCGKTQKQNFCSVREWYTDESPCFSVKVGANQSTLMDVLKVNYTLCWTEGAKKETPIIERELVVIALFVLVILVFIAICCRYRRTKKKVIALGRRRKKDE